MKFENKVMPNDEQMAEFLDPGNDEPIYMVNLLKFKDKAEYPDKRETDLSGRAGKCKTNSNFSMVLSRCYGCRNHCRSD